MKTLYQLYNGFFLNHTCANMQISNCPKNLRVAPLLKSKNLDSLNIDDTHYAFAEKNKNGDIEYFNGLKYFLQIDKPDFPTIFIFDNHNHAPIFWYNIIYSLNENIELVHIDQHSDCRENNSSLDLNREENQTEVVFNFFNQKCNVGNFIIPAIKSGIISQQNQIRSISGLKNLNIIRQQPFILDIDLDFCLNGNNRSTLNQEAIKILTTKFKELGKLALCTTIATSPYFLDQKIAINIIKQLLEESET